LGLVGVAADVLLHLAARQEPGLLAHREAGPSPPAQARVLERLLDLVLVELAEGALERPVAAAPAVAVDRREPRLVYVPEEQSRLGRHRSAPAWAHSLPRALPVSPAGRRARARSGITSAPRRSWSTMAAASASPSGP